MTRKLDLVGASEIAERTGCQRTTVAQWYKRGRMPKPAAVLAMGPVWLWTDVHAWLLQTGRLGDKPLSDDVEPGDGVLRFYYCPTCDIAGQATATMGSSGVIYVCGQCWTRRKTVETLELAEKRAMRVRVNALVNASNESRRSARLSALIGAASESHGRVRQAP